MANAGYLQGPERRRRILEAAKRVFAARGYHDTNISHICDDLGIARGTLYQYFDSKKDVFTAIVEDLLARLRAVVEATPKLEVPEGFRPTEDQIVRFAASSLKRLLRVVFEDEDTLRILVREAIGLDVQIDGILRAIDEIVAERCARDIETAQRAGLVRSDVDARRAAVFILGGIQKLALDALSRNRGGDVDIEALALEATRLQMTGLLAK